MPTTRTLSVALCTFDGERHLPEQLESLLLQIRLPDEVVVGDDGSNDATLDLLADFAGRAPFPVRIETHERLGPNGNFAATIDRCTGDLIALCDQDDRWHPDRLRIGEEALAGAPGAHLAFGDADLVDEAGRPLGRSLWASIGVGAREQAALCADPLPALLRRPMATGCTVTFRRELLQLAAPLPHEAGMQHDRWLALCAAALGDVVTVDEPLVEYRVHGQQHTGLGPLSTATGRPRGRLHWSRWRNVRRTGDDRLAPAVGQVDLLAERLASRPATGRSDEARATLSDARLLLDHRATLPERRIRRVRPVAHHLLRGHYHRYATGLVGAAVDLVRR